MAVCVDFLHNFCSRRPEDTHAKLAWLRFGLVFEAGTGCVLLGLRILPAERSVHRLNRVSFLLVLLYSVSVSLVRAGVTEIGGDVTRS